MGNGYVHVTKPYPFLQLNRDSFKNQLGTDKCMYYKLDKKIINYNVAPFIVFSRYLFSYTVL